MTHHDINLASISQTLNKYNEFQPNTVPPIDEKTVILRGTVNYFRLRTGLTLHTTDVTEVYDVHAQNEVKPGLTFLYFDHGEVDVRYGDRNFHFGTTADNAERPRAFIINRSEPDFFSRKMRAGAKIRKLVVSVTPEWLDIDGMSALEQPSSLGWLFNERLSNSMLAPQPRLQALIEQVMRPPTMPQPMQSLYLESKAIEIISEMLSSLSPHQNNGSGLHVIEQRKLNSALNFIDENLEQISSIDEIAAYVGISASSLQRLFRKAIGSSVFDYVRNCRMKSALAALKTSSVSIQQAAYLAGYTNQANFATAFRKMFGFTPSQARDHMS